MKKFFLIITCVALVMCVYGIDTVKGVFDFFDDSVIMKVTGELAELGDSENVNDFRQYPLLNIDSTLFGTFTNRYNEIIQVNSFMKYNVLPSYLVESNNYNYSVKVTMSSRIYDIVIDSNSPILSDLFIKSVNLSQCVRLRIVLKYGDNVFNYNLFISINDNNAGYKPLYFIQQEGSRYGWIGSGFVSFENFLSNLESDDKTNPFLLPNDYTSYVLQSSIETIELVNTMLSTLYDQLNIK